MLATLAQEIRDELVALSSRYGVPVLRAVEIDGKEFDPLNRRDRLGEVCMVIRRRTGRLLTAIKTFYPAGAYRLLTGGIGQGESILGGLAREVREETGLETEVRRFLAVVSYTRAGTAVFHTFAFLLDDVGGALRAGDPEERVAAFREIRPAELPALARRLAGLDGEAAAIGGNWRDWGRFRAVIHEVVWQALGEPR